MARMAETNVVHLPGTDSAERDQHRYAALRARSREIESEITALNEAIWRTSQESAETDLNAAAGVLIDGGALPSVIDQREKLAGLQREAAVVRRAVRLLRPKIDAEKRRDASQIAARLRPEYLQAIAKIAAGLEMIAEGNAALDRVFYQIPGGSGGLLRAQFPGIGRPDDFNSPSYYWHKFVQQHGLLHKRRAAE